MKRIYLLFILAAVSLSAVSCKKVIKGSIELTTQEVIFSRDGGSFLVGTNSCYIESLRDENGVEIKNTWYYEPQTTDYYREGLKFVKNEWLEAHLYFKAQSASIEIIVSPNDTGASRKVLVHVWSPIGFPSKDIVVTQEY